MHHAFPLPAIVAIGCGLISLGCASTTGKHESTTPSGQSTIEVVQASDVTWGPLNPARGDDSPRAGNLWGDRGGSGASGFLVKFVDGFSSPPHIHNITYRAVVIEGLIHNDDANADRMWMPPGSFWTQPAGAAHITAADANQNMAYVEIDDGPYLVLPTDEAFEDGHEPINVDASNIVWLDASDLVWIDHPDASTPGPQMAFLWGDPGASTPSGSMLRLPVGFDGSIRTHGSSFRAVLISGGLEHSGSALGAGGYFGSSGPAHHRVRVTSEHDAVIYVRSAGGLDIHTGR